MSGRMEREVFLDAGKPTDTYQFFVDGRIGFDVEKLIQVFLMFTQQFPSFPSEE